MTIWNVKTPINWLLVHNRILFVGRKIYLLLRRSCVRCSEGGLSNLRHQDLLFSVVVETQISCKTKNENNNIEAFCESMENFEAEISTWLHLNDLVRIMKIKFILICHAKTHEQFVFNLRTMRMLKMIFT